VELNVIHMLHHTYLLHDKLFFEKTNEGWVKLQVKSRLIWLIWPKIIF